MIKVAHIVGNGESWADFKKINETDFVIGCNATKCKEADVTIVSDMRMCNQIVHLAKWNRLEDVKNVPIISGAKVTEWVTNTPEVSEWIQVYDTFDKEEWFEPFAMSSAHSAVLWAIKNNYTEIHVWGIDSYFAGHTFSYTDKMVPSLVKKDMDKVKRMAELWKDNWDLIIKQYPDINITLHRPEVGV